MKKTVFILGNPMIASDSLPVKLIPKLKKEFSDISFAHLDPTENLIPPQNGQLILIDTVLGIEEVVVFNDLSSFSISPRNSVHDYDLILDLSLLKKLKKIRSVTIIGIPPKGNLRRIEKEVKKIFKSSQL